MGLNIFPQTLCSGDMYPLKLTFKDPTTGNPYDMTGSIIGLTVKELPQNGDDSNAVFQANISGDTTGVFNFLIGPLVAGNWWVDVKMWKNTVRSSILPPIQMHVIQSVTSR